MELCLNPLVTVTTRSFLGAAEAGDANPARKPAKRATARMLASDGQSIVFIKRSAGEPISAKSKTCSAPMKFNSDGRVKCLCGGFQQIAMTIQHNHQWTRMNTNENSRRQRPKLPPQPSSNC